MSFGSFWSGIKMCAFSIYLHTSHLPDPISVPHSQEIDSNGKPKGSLTALATRPSNVGGAVEAAKLFKYGAYYYLFTSWDKCCSGTASTYSIRVGRSSAVTGPYKDKAGVALTAGGGTLVLGKQGVIAGPGGQDVFQDADGPILVYRAY